MTRIGHTRNLFLRSISIIYVFAFLSLYVQIPGLYGNNGILPARNHLQDTSAQSLSEKMYKKPTLLWFAPYLGLNTEYMMDVLCIIGILVSFCCFISFKFCTAPVFAALWLLYYSLYQVGQTFMKFQWDSLLLETGFLTIFVTPWKFNSNYSKQPLQSPSDNVTFFLIRWLFFRFMFSSGVVKLQSGCPLWWGLTAMNVYFESEPIPTLSSWYLHHLPTWFLKLCTVYSHIAEQILPFLFFFPLRSVRIAGYYLTLFLQFGIIIAGNYTFYNFLIFILCFSLADDQLFLKKEKGIFKSTSSNRFLSIAVNLLVHGFVIYIAVVFYGVRLTPKWTFESEITFTKAEFDLFLKRAVAAGIYLGGGWLFIISVQAVLNSFRGPQAKLTTILVTLFYVSVAFFLFGISLVPYSALHKSTNITTMPQLRKLYNRLEPFQISNSYGSFRRMTGVGGRPEIIIEGSNDLKGPWVEYYFRYKPGDVNATLKYGIPHHPRLDWQMWYAAQGTYHQNPWLMSTAYRILEGEKGVINLLDSKRIPFSKPPKYLKASLYHYHFTPWSKRKSTTAWIREPAGEYFPIFTKDHTPLVDYLKTVKILDSKESLEADNKLVNPMMKTTLDWLRNGVSQFDPVIIAFTVFTAGLAIISSIPSFDMGSGSGTHKKKF